MKVSRKSNSGFTLIELMVVVVIISILAGIAYPSYKNYTIKSKRSDAYSALTEAATDQEKFYSKYAFREQHGSIKFPEWFKCDHANVTGRLLRDYNHGRDDLYAHRYSAR